MANTARSYVIASAPQLEALGRMTLFFGIIDEQISHAAVTLRLIQTSAEQRDGLTSAAWCSRELLCVQRKGFKKKCSIIRECVNTVGSEADSEQPLLRLLDGLAALADHRNDIVHGWIYINEREDRAEFRNRNKSGRSVEAEDVEELNHRLFEWHLEFQRCFFDFIAESDPADTGQAS